MEGLTNGLVYSFQVVAANAFGSSARSLPSNKVGAAGLTRTRLTESGGVELERACSKAMRQQVLSFDFSRDTMAVEVMDRSYLFRHSRAKGGELFTGGEKPTRRDGARGAVTGRKGMTVIGACTLR